MKRALAPMLRVAICALLCASCRARESAVEVMCHPGFDHELEALRSPAWAEQIADLPLGSYRDLA